VPENSGHLTFQLPELPEHWQFVVNTIPAQMAVEHLARLSGVDCDSFRVCSFIVEDDTACSKRLRPLLFSSVWRGKIARS